MTTQVSSRQEQILTLLLNASSGLSIDDMARQLGITRTAVKQHLTTLEKQRLVQESSFNTSTGGRPARSYELTTEGINRFPKQYAWFCGLLLNELATTMSTEAMERLMWNMGAKLASSLAPQFDHKDPAQKLSALIQLMQSLGYHAEFTPQDDAPHIKALNCVYHDLAQQYPALCQFDQALISTLLATPIVQTACIAKKDCFCTFKVITKEN